MAIARTLTPEHQAAKLAGWRRWWDSLTPEQRSAHGAARSTPEVNARRAASKRLPWTDEMIAELSRVLRAGGTMIEAAARVGVCVETARSKARELGLPIPARGGRPRA